MLRLFGKPLENSERPVCKIQESIRMLERREQYLQEKLEKELVTARTNARAGNKRGLWIPF